MKTTIKFAKVKPNAILPSKRDEDAGFDIYACFEEDYIMINPHETKLIPTGIASNCSKDYCFILKERGSTGSKGIAQRCGVIDSGYTGEWFVPITNTTNKTILISKLNARELYDLYNLIASDCIYPYTKAIAQALVVPVPKVKIEEISYEELQSIKTKRGNGALGSSNK
jgi:dUTP pyrophosphatase